MKGVEIAKEIFERKREIFENYREYARLIKKALGEILKNEPFKVIVFGSMPKKKYTPLSDLDILIITERDNEKINYGKLVEEVEKRVGKK